MRNDWFPGRMAEYVTEAQLRELGMKGVVLERDSLFGSRQKKPATDVASTDKEEPSVIPVSLGLLTVRTGHRFPTYIALLTGA